MSSRSDAEQTRREAQGRWPGAGALSRMVGRKEGSGTARRRDGPGSGFRDGDDAGARGAPHRDQAALDCYLAPPLVWASERDARALRTLG